MSIADQFLEFDALLAQNDEPPLSAFWSEQARRFLDDYEAGRSIEWWGCVGRGGSKTTTALKLVTFVSLFVPFRIPRHQTHYALVLSKSKSQAQEGIAKIESWLTALGIPNRATGEVIMLTGRNRGVRVVSASVGATSGHRCFLVFADERGKWSEDGEAVLFDGEQTMASARATTVTHPNAMLLVFSTPWLAEGDFYETITAGSRDGRTVIQNTPSWIANPDAITEEHTHKLERTPQIWRREYACEFVESFADGFFPAHAIERCVDPQRNVSNEARGNWLHVVAIDPAFEHDGFGQAVAHVEPRDAGPVVWVDFVASLKRPLGATMLSPAYAVTCTHQLRVRFPGGSVVYSDQREAASLTEAFLAKGMVLRVQPWTMANKIEMYETVRNLMLDGRVRLPNIREMRNELGNIGYQHTKAGNLTIGSRGRDDIASALVMCVYCAYKMGAVAMEGLKLSEPIALGRRRELALSVSGSVFGSGVRPTGDPFVDALNESLAEDR